MYKKVFFSLFIFSYLHYLINSLLILLYIQNMYLFSIISVNICIIISIISIIYRKHSVLLFSNLPLHLACSSVSSTQSINASHSYSAAIHSPLPHLNPVHTSALTEIPKLKVKKQLTLTWLIYSRYNILWEIFDYYFRWDLLVRSFSRSFVRQFIHSFFQSFICSIVHSAVIHSYLVQFVCIFVQSFVYSYIRSAGRLYIRSVVCLFVYSFGRWFVYSFTRTFVQLFVRLYIRSVVRLFTRTFVKSYIRSVDLFRHSFFKSFVRTSFNRSCIRKFNQVFVQSVICIIYTFFTDLNEFINLSCLRSCRIKMIV